MSSLLSIADTAPTEQLLTAYDMFHIAIYRRLLEADIYGEAWEEAARVVLGLDPKKDEARAKRIWASHLDRARWIAAKGDDILIDIHAFWNEYCPRQR